MAKIKYRKFKVHYLDQKGNECVFDSRFSLCEDGAEEAARYELGHRLKEILYLEEY